MPRSVVTEYDPRREMFRRLSLAGLVLLAAVLGGVTGYHYAGPAVPDSPDSLAAGAPSSDRGAIALEQRLINAETAAEVDRRALESLRVELAERRGEVAELKQAVGFYRNLMAPDEVDKPVSVGAVEFTPGNLAGRYQYRIVVQQTAKKHSELRGTLGISFAAVRGEEPVSLALAELTADGAKDAIPLQFKYFQSIEGEISVPEDLLLTEVSLAVRITRPMQLELDHQLPWLMEH